MKIKLIVVGDFSQTYLREATQVFEKRLKHYVAFETWIIKPFKPGDGGRPEVFALKEGEAISSKISKGDFVVVLDEKGKSLSSAGMAGFLAQLMNQSVRSIVFVIGGAYGISDELKKKADLLLRLSDMTLTHEMARLFFIEQLYRAHTIIRNEKYHH